MLNIFYNFLANIIAKRMAVYTNDDIKILFHQVNIIKYLPKPIIDRIPFDVLTEYIFRHPCNMKYTHKLNSNVRDHICTINPHYIRYCGSEPPKHLLLLAARTIPGIFLQRNFKTMDQDVILESIKNEWSTDYFYFIQNRFNIEEETMREINKLKLKYGPMK